MGALSLAGGLISSGIASANASKAAEESRKEYAQKAGMLNRIFDKQYYQDVTQRSEVQDILRLYQENSDRQATRDNAVAAISGSTPEEKLAAQDSRNKSYANVLADVASNASQLKDSYLNNYIQQRLGITNPEASIYSNISNQWAQTGSNLMQTGAKMLGNSDFSGIGSGSTGMGNSGAEALNKLKADPFLNSSPKGV